MYDFDVSTHQSPFRGKDTLKALVVSEGITSIGDYAFENTTALTSATLPTTLKLIGDGAFMQADNYIGVVHGLTDIIIPNGVTEILGGAFWGSAITALTIPVSATVFGKYICRSCAKLETVRYEGKEIGAYMFVSCTRLKNFTIASTVKKISEHVLNYCTALETIVYEGTLEL